jgi:hypothetical protein
MWSGIMIVFFGILLGLAALLALPPALKTSSRTIFWKALGLSFVGIVLPLLVFVFSAALTPDSKAASPDGWIDCWHVGKLALTPVVLWAVAAWYALEIWEVQRPPRCWVVCGVCSGALVAAACTLFGFTFCDRDGSALLFLMVPLYVAIWYLIRAIQLARGHFRPVLLTMLGSLPLWVLSVIWARSKYVSLPEQSGCFIVTAASRGHRSVVGPLTTVRRGGVDRLANRQLLRFWQFEMVWCEGSPGTHALFRRLYNRLGPKVARRIRTPLAADAMYAALKPAEMIAVGVLAAAAEVPSIRNLTFKNELS